MFQLTMGNGQNMATPDVCLTPVPTPAGPVPTPLPYPNINIPVNSSPVASTVLTVGMPVINQLSKGLISTGDEAGTQGGVISHVVSGQTNYIQGSFTVFVGGALCQRMSSTTGQNAQSMLSNAMGACIAPTQTTVLILG